MERVYIAGTPSEAVIVQHKLNAVGIESRLVGDELFALRGAVPLEEGTLPMILVHEDDIPQAMLVIQEWEATKKMESQGPKWNCGCGEELESQFNSCWSCGAPRP